MPMKPGPLYRPEYGLDVFVHNDMAYTRDANEEFVNRIENFPVSDDDVIVVGCPKSGTNWLNITLANLYDHWETTKITRHGSVPEFSVPSDPITSFMGYDECIAASSRRLMKTHLPFSHMPRAHREHGIGKVIYIARNPKDACDSFYNNLKDYFVEGWGWNDHLEAFLRGTVPFGSWLKNVIGWSERGEAQGVLHITYEGMQRDKRGTLERLVKFIGPTMPGAIDRVLSLTDFEAMKTNALGKQYQPNMKRRDAKIGGWKRHFTVSQSERFDEVLGPVLRERGLDFIYENNA